jgi:hypothetical protein
MKPLPDPNLQKSGPPHLYAKGCTKITGANVMITIFVDFCKTSDKQFAIF